MIKDSLKLSGALNVVLKDANGAVKQEQNINNLVVSAGLAFITSRMEGTSSAVMSHMAVGSGSTAADAADTGLGSELGRVSLTSTTQDANTIEYVATFGAGTGTGAVTEAGVFNDGSAGDMLCRTVFSVVNKAADDTLTITWTITLSAS